MSQIRGKTEDSAEDVVIYGEAEPEILTKKLAKGSRRVGLRPTEASQARKSYYYLK